MNAVITWLKDYWYVPLLAIGAILTLFFLPHRGTRNFQKTMTELGAIRSRRETRAVALKDGNEAAKKHVREKYAAKMETLDAQAETKVKELEDDPVALGEYLDRLADPDAG